MDTSAAGDAPQTPLSSTEDERKGTDVDVNAMDDASPGSSMPESARYDDGGLSDDSNFSDDEEEFLPSSHRLMDRPLRALEAQLKKQNDELSNQMSEKSEQIARLKNKREQVGVELYSFQQQLAKLQQVLEEKHDQFNAESRARLQCDDDLKTVGFLFDEKKKDHDELHKKWEQSHKELERLNITLKQIDDFNQELTSDIKNTRRAAYGTEEHMQQLEKEKRRQDEEIDRLSERLQETQGKLHTFKESLEAQRMATQQAVDTLREATRDMEAIAAEKRDYVQKWKSSLVGMARRDTALQQTQVAIQEHIQEMQNTDNEIAGFKASIREQQHEHEQLTGVLTRVEAETQFVASQIENLNNTRKNLNDQYEVLRKSVEEADKQLKLANSEQRRHQSSLDQLQKQVERESRAKQELEDKLDSNQGDQTTIEKGRQNIYKALLKLRQTMRQREIDNADTQNELARIKVDSLNTDAHNKELQEVASQFTQELTEKDKLIEKYQQEIRQRHDQIEKKQMHIVRLNRQYETLTSGLPEEENTGPLEATINHLKKEIEQKRKESTELQRSWIRLQTTLVQLTEDSGREEQALKESKARQTITEQKKLRLENQFAQLNHEIDGLQRGIGVMHSGTSKLNQLIAENKKLIETLTNDNFHAEVDFMEKLKELEKESDSLTAKKEELKAEKDRLFEDIVETERQIMLWEKKIQLERETQAALDPEYGQPEIRGMKKEIHRMELRLGQLQRQQEKMIQEMERTIAKVESIKMKHTATKSQSHLTRATLKKRIMDLKDKLKKNALENQRLARELKLQENENNALVEDLETAQREYDAQELSKEELEKGIDVTERERQLLQHRVALEYKKERMFRKAAENKYSTKRLTREKVLARMEDEQTKARKTEEVITQLSEQNPKFSDLFQQLGQLLKA